MVVNYYVPILLNSKESVTCMDVRITITWINRYVPNSAFDISSSAFQITSLERFVQQGLLLS
jgi:hypothetical protein